jgi:hypothetical protein
VFSTSNLSLLLSATEPNRQQVGKGIWELWNANFQPQDPRAENKRGLSGLSYTREEEAQWL